MMVALWLALAFALQIGPSSQNEDDISKGLKAMYRYENPVNRDHYYFIEPYPNLTIPGFNFSEYRYDGYVGHVLSANGYKTIVEPHPEMKRHMLAVYHGYHRNLKHNYFSKPWEPRDFHKPAFYCSRKKHHLHANETLWTLDGQPIDSVGDLGYDTIYTTHLVERDLPNVEDYVMYRILCYIWPAKKSSKPIVPKPSASRSSTTTSTFIHQYDEFMTRLYQYYNENDQDSYYSLSYNETKDEDRSNFINVVALIVKEQDKDEFKAANCSQKLVLLIQAYSLNSTDARIFVGEDNFKRITDEDKQKGEVYDQRVNLGYVAPEASSDGCQARYRLNVYQSLGLELINQKDNSTQEGLGYPDKDVYIAEKPRNPGDQLYHDQYFYIW